MISMVGTIKHDSHPISLDLIFEILVRLPVKSLVRFRCVSKLWSSIICCRDFSNSFLARSSTRPYLLNFMYDDSNAYIFFVPTPESSSVASLGLTIPKKVDEWVRLNSFHGLICFEDDSQIVICNPATRQLISIPLCEYKYLQLDKSVIYLGYDTVNDQYKVLRTSKGLRNGFSNNEMISEHHIFVLGAGNSWKSIKDSFSHHYPVFGMREVYVNGILYYGASFDLKHGINSSVIVGFDFTSEEFNFIKVPSGIQGYWYTDTATLINHEEKVALIEYYSLLIMELDYFDIWVLEDAQKGQWSKMICVRPSYWHVAPSWCDCLGKIMYFHGTIHTGEIVTAERGPLFDSFYVFYYDIKKNSIRKVEIEGLPTHDAFGGYRIMRNCLDHLENIMFLDDYSLSGIVPETLHEFRQQE